MNYKPHNISFSSFEGCDPIGRAIPPQALGDDSTCPTPGGFGLAVFGGGSRLIAGEAW